MRAKEFVLLIVPDDDLAIVAIPSHTLARFFFLDRQYSSRTVSEYSRLRHHCNAKTISSNFIMTNTASTTSSAVNPSEVGWQFVPQYYTFVNKQPNRLHCFYTKASTFIHGTEGEDGKPCFGQQVRAFARARVPHRFIVARFAGDPRENHLSWLPGLQGVHSLC